MSWEKDTRWTWRADRVTNRQYPGHGTAAVQRGKLKGSTETDYFHFDCPSCDEKRWGLDVELLGVRDDSEPNHPKARTILLGLSCPACGMRDLVKIGCLESEEYQPRRTGWLS